MKTLLGSLVTAFIVSASFSTSALITFVGTNAPGTGSNFNFTLGPSATNLSLVISNDANSFSYLLLKKGGTPTDTSFDFISRLDGQTNEINLEPPQYGPGIYGLRISTPPASSNQIFQAVLTTNRTDLRSAAYPVLKPLAFTATGVVTNTVDGQWQYYQVDMPSNLSTGWRVVVSCTNGVNPALYVRRGALPDTGSFDKSAIWPTVETVTFTSAETTNATYFIGVHLTGAVSSANYTVTAELASVNTLTWDSGTTDAGTQVFTNQSATGGDYYFAITTQSTANGIWRTALNVTGGEADVYLVQGGLPTTNSASYFSTRVGSDGFVLSQAGNQFSPGQNWFYLVHATPGAQWNLVTGEAYVQQLADLAADGSSSGNHVTMGAEGMHFFKTTITTNTLAWRLGLNGLANQLYVKQTSAPHPLNTSTYDLTQPGQMLVVPTYLKPGSQYFVGVVGNPGLFFNLDSRQQSVTTIPFTHTDSITIVSTNYGYKTFLVQVPVQQIAWQVNTTPTVGSASVAVRRDNVPNEFVNDAYSDTGGGIGNSVTLVPPTLSDGSFYVTVYGSGAYTCTLVNGQPIITPVNYVFAITNDAPNRVGWRYYTVVDTTGQLGTLGWDLELSGAPTGTEIAIRRNAVPGAWNYRTDPFDNYAFGTLSYVDLAGTRGFLQQPNHPADVWYIGVYSPTNALGSFTLTGSQLQGPAVGFDGAAANTNVVNQPGGKYQFFKFTVPPNALGWDIRVTNVTAGTPTMAVCRELLPVASGGPFWYPYYSTNWPSGYEWLPGSDWTGDYYNFNGSVSSGQVLAMGMGNPLEPGTYYVGMVDLNGAPSSYTLVSRGIGAGFSIPVNSIAFTNGSVTKANLPGREAAYYSVVIPPNTPSWRIELATNSGESLLCVEKDFLPNIGANNNSPYNPFGGRKLQKVGNEQYLLLPPNGQTNVTAGTYYLAAVSEGIGSVGGTLGQGASGFTLNSYGSENITNLGALDPNGVVDLILTNTGLKSGQFGLYQFSVPSNVLGLEVRLENKTGDPGMTLRADGQLPGEFFDYYGTDGGQGSTWSDRDIINIANPISTNYTLMVEAISAGGDASYRVRVHAIGPQPINFDGGKWTVTNQPANTWQYFIINVPSDANVLGWDIRITNTFFSGNSQPYLYVCRDVAPSQANPNNWIPYYSTTWPSGYQWQASYDWSAEGYTADSMPTYGQVLAMGMGNPLQPGTYYVGVLNLGGLTPVSYTLTSRGIGNGLSIPVTPLAFTNGVATQTALPLRDAAYYSVVVPSNMPSWILELHTNLGESLLCLQKDSLPNVNAANNAPYTLAGGRKMEKRGNEQYIMMPLPGQTTITPGTYYLTVASQGVGENSGYLGTGPVGFTLNSSGSLNVSNLGVLDNVNFIDLITTNLLEEGQIVAYQFTVQPNTLGMELRLQNKTGNPNMTYRPGDPLVAVYDGYGNDGGESPVGNDANLINVANPAPGDYTIMVQANANYGAAGFQLRVRPLGPQPVTFDGGTYSVASQPPNNWQYFIINVPNEPGLLGWDLRLTNIIGTGVDPVIVVARDTAPYVGNPYFWYPNFSSTWPSGYQWQASADWTGDGSEADGGVAYGHVLAMGIGNPLQPGTYYVGVIDQGAATPSSYTLVSRGIGPGYSIPVNNLAFNNGVVSNNSLVPREAAYYKVVVPTNIPDWKVRLSNITGESLLAIQKDALPSTLAGANPSYGLYGGHKMQKFGNEQYLMLPQAGDTNVVAGTYYLAVISEGQNPAAGIIGTNASAFFLSSLAVQNVTNLGVVGVSDVLRPGAIQGGENALFRFTVPSGPNAVEVRLDNITGSPFISLATDTNIVYPYYAYGWDGGALPFQYGPSLITLPNVVPTNYSVTVQATPIDSVNFPDANFIVHLRQMPTPTLLFDAFLNSGGLSNSATGTLLDGQNAFYKVTVPPAVNGQPVIGWKLDIAETSGSPRIRVRRDFLPDDYNYYEGVSPGVIGEGIYVAPYLTPGTWYVEVRGSGVSSYTLTSSSLQLKRPAWNMPAVGSNVTTAGLPPGGPLFADTGILPNGQTNGSPDLGTDLANGAFDYYEIIVPTNNSGVLRTRLDAISGNPNLYIRSGTPPSLSHSTYGNYGSAMYDRSLNANGGSEYGNWVPMDGRHEINLASGPWYLAVLANNSNVRYRLRMDIGSISALSLSGGSYNNQLLTAGDWSYYKVFIPTNAPVNWNLSIGIQLGNLNVYIRDRVPPGEASSESDLRDWFYDNKNHGPYPSFSASGNYTLSTPPLRPGNAYYIGFRATVDSVFSISNTTNGGSINYTTTIPFQGGFITNNIPPFGQVKFRVDVPEDALEWIDTTVHGTNVSLFIDQGSVPTMTASDDFASINQVNVGLDVSLLPLESWPWVPGYSYFVTATNIGNSIEPFSFTMGGVRAVASMPTQFTGVVPLPTGQIQLNMQVNPHIGYQLQSSPDLYNWQTILQFVPTDNIFQYVDNGGEPVKFFRLIPQ